MAPAVQQKNNIFLFIVRLLMVMIEYNFRPVPILNLVKTTNLSKINNFYHVNITFSK